MKIHLPTDGLVLVVKRDCPTCQLVAPVAVRLAELGLLSCVYSQDDPGFPDNMDTIIDDRELEASYRLGIDIVPTLVCLEAGRETARAIGWHRDEWAAIADLDDLAPDLPAERPGCGSLSIAPGMAEELTVRFGDPGLTARRIEIAFPTDEFDELVDRGWTDGLPVVPPTAARVLRMLQGTRRMPDEIVGNIPPALVPCTIEKVAINAVMAGCRPEYLPVVLAALEAALDPDYTWNGLLSTTAGAGTVIIVNGPIAGRIGMNWGGNALGHGNQANATIGRALQLVAYNVGSAKPGGVDRSTLGHPGKFGVAFAEDETDDAWQPLAQTRNIAAGRSAVTVFCAIGAVVFYDESPDSAETLADTFATKLEVMNPGLNRSNMLIVLSPEHWAIFKSAGWKRADIEKALNDRAVRWKDDLLLVQAGGRAGLMSVIMPGWGGGETRSQPVTREVML